MGGEQPRTEILEFLRLGGRLFLLPPPQVGHPRFDLAERFLPFLDDGHDLRGELRGHAAPGDRVLDAHCDFCRKIPVFPSQRADLSPDFLLPELSSNDAGQQIRRIVRPGSDQESVGRSSFRRRSAGG